MHGDVSKRSQRDALEMRLSRNRHVGSNPTVSAINFFNVPNTFWYDFKF